MKRFLVPALLAVLLVAACGEKPAEQANPLSLVPENAMVTVILNDPAGVVRNIDGYIEDGAPILGANMLENLICEQLAIPSLDSMPERYGFDPSGLVVFWMENAMPNSMGLAVSAPDLPLFLSLMEEMGAEFTDEEPVQGNPVYSIDTGDGTVYVTGSGGIAIMTMSRAKVETLLGSLSDQGAEVAPTSFTMHLNLAMIGPMVAGQMPMARTMIMQGLAEDPTMPEFVPGIMDVYMDGIQLVLTQTDQMEVVMEIGPEDLVITKNVTFLEGSELAGMMVPQGGRDMLALIPAGDVATVRFRMPREMASGITEAFTEVFASDVPMDNLDFWADMASNAGMAVYGDSPMHIVAAYDLQEGVTLQDIADSYTEYMGIFTEAFQGAGEMGEFFTIADNGLVDYEGTEFYSMSMDIEVDTLSSMSFDYWMTIYDGALLLELAEEPSHLLDVVSGGYDPASLAGSGDMSGEMSLAGYLSMIMAMSPNGMDLPEIGSDVVIRWDGGFENGGMNMKMTLNGRDALATGFAFFGLLSATM